MDATQWDTLSDLEINTSVALALGGYVCSWPNPPRLGVTFDGVYAVDVDYCNNPSDAWPIIIKNKISTTWVGSYWSVIAPIDKGMFSYKARTDDEVFRAGMIVFLMMQEDKP